MYYITKEDYMKSDRFDMVSYDHVRERGCMSFISTKGAPLSIWIHRATWEALMTDNWNYNELGDPTLWQTEMKTAAKSVVKKDYVKWFANKSNELMVSKTKGEDEQ